MPQLGPMQHALHGVSIFALFLQMMKAGISRTSMKRIPASILCQLKNLKKTSYILLNRQQVFLQKGGSMIANSHGFIKYEGNELDIIKDLIGLVYVIRTQGKKDFNPITMAILDSGLKKILNDEFPTV